MTVPARISMGAAGLAVAIGAMVLTGWAVGSERLISIDMRLIAMLPNTAAGVMVAGATVLALHQPRSPRRLSLARAAGALLFALGLLVLLSRWTGTELLHVGALFRERVSAYPYRPVGLFATNSSVAFMLLGIALVLVGDQRRWLRSSARLCATLALTIAAVALMGHLYGARALFTIDRFAGMAMLTALSFACVAVGVLFLPPHEGAMSLLVERDLAGRLLRRLLPATALVPVILGALLIKGREESLFSRETGVALFTVLLTGWIVAALLFNARYLRRADEARTKLLEREQTLRAAAEQASQAKSDFLGVMSHELRTPLNAVIGYTDLMESGITGPLTQDQRTHLSRIRSSAAHLIRTVSDILSLTRLDAHVGQAVFEPVPVRAVLDDVAGILAPLAAARKLTLSCTADGDPVALGDAHGLRQILVNLGGNAVKFTDAGTVTLHATQRDGHVVIAVTDTGIGIAPADLARIFDEFWQAQGQLTRRYDGAGLGLAVSRRLARQMGGDVVVESELGRGSRFTVNVPAAETAAAAYSSGLSGLTAQSSPESA